MNAVVRSEPQDQYVAVRESSIDRIITAALDQNADLDRIEQLYALKRQYEADEARKAYVSAMAAFKAEPLRIVKDKKVAFSGTSYTHASIGNVVGVICAGLGAHGFSHRWNTEQKGTDITVTCIITHERGHSESTSLTAKPDDSGKKNGIQQVASTITYLERYTLLAATGMATSDQDDSDGRNDEPEETPEQAEAKRAAEAREQSWMDAFDGAGDLPALEKLQRELIDACGGRDKVPDKLKGAYMARKKALAK